MEKVINDDVSLQITPTLNMLWMYSRWHKQLLSSSKSHGWLFPFVLFRFHFVIFFAWIFADLSPRKKTPTNRGHRTRHRDGVNDGFSWIKYVTESFTPPPSAQGERKCRASHLFTALRYSGTSTVVDHTQCVSSRKEKSKKQKYRLTCLYK